MEKQRYWRNSATQWGIISRFLHWGMAGLIIGMLILGFYMSGLNNSPFKFSLYGIHKAIGVGVLGVLIFRLGWRLSHTLPQMMPVSSAHKFLAKMSVPVLYTILFLMPLSGICMSQAAGYPIFLGKEYTLIQVIDKNPALAQLAVQVHKTMAWVLVGVIVIHSLAVLYHTFYLKDHLLKRMWKKM